MPSKKQSLSFLLHSLKSLVNSPRLRLRIEEYIDEPGPPSRMRCCCNQTKEPKQYPMLWEHDVFLPKVHPTDALNAIKYNNKIASKL